jgi:hypothetical protein
VILHGTDLNAQLDGTFRRIKDTCKNQLCGSLRRDESRDIGRSLSSLTSTFNPTLRITKKRRVEGAKQFRHFMLSCMNCLAATMSLTRQQFAIRETNALMQKWTKPAILLKKTKVVGRNW